MIPPPYYLRIHPLTIKSKQIDIGSVWLHTKGFRYKVLMLVNLQSENLIKFPPSVVYQREVDNTLWSRPIDNWFESMTLIE